jgi:Xaa-Pro dipeptidase
VTSPANLRYLTGVRLDPLWTSAARSMAVVVPTDGRPVVVAPDFVVGEVAGRCPEATVVAFDPPREDIAEALATALALLPAGSVGWEAGRESRLGIPLIVHQALSNRDAVDVAAALWDLRMRKDPEEVAALAAAALAVSQAFAAVYEQGVEGRTEQELARALGAAALLNGADTVGWVACTSGAGSYDRFLGEPRPRTVERGDLFWADVGATVDGYWTDFCRAAVAGPVSPARRDFQDAVVAATAAGVACCRPGTPVAEVADAVRHAAADAGVPLLGFGRLGHGIGLSSTEPPSLAAWDPSVLEAGMVVTVEPAVVATEGIFCAEQVVAVTDGDPVVLSGAPTGLWSG